MLPQDLALRGDEDGRVVETLPFPFGQPSRDIDARPLRGLAQRRAVTARYRLRQFASRRVGPAQVEALGQDHHRAPLLPRPPDHLYGPFEVALRLASLDQCLAHTDVESTASQFA